VKEDETVPPPADADRPTGPITVGVTVEETVPNASVVSVQDVKPHASSVAPEADNVTATPETGGNAAFAVKTRLVALPRLTCTLNGTLDDRPRYAPFAGEDSTVSTSGGAVAVKEAEALPPPAQAVSATVPLAVAVTAVEIVP
jgi:hypothetical protein